ncbi:MAG: hypothetical protein R8K54_05050 [Mariprofundaceae bacterium]
MKYQSADQWRDTAMSCATGVTEEESERRRKMVGQYDLKEGMKSDTDALADYELYILGKMDMEEYQQYLLFKHGGDH